MIKLSSSGSYKKTLTYLTRQQKNPFFSTLDRYGAQGVAALRSATPKDQSVTANSWDYKIVRKRGFYSIQWTNSHVDNGVPIAVILQYGHGTRNGGYVQGRDYINPAIRPIFDQIVADMWKAVTQ